MAEQVQVIDYRAKYEKLLRETMKEFQTAVRTAQLRAEENSRVNQQGVSELTEQLKRSEETVQDLRQLLEETRSRLSSTEEQLLHQRIPVEEDLTQKRLELLESLSCLSVEVRRENGKVIYHCTLDDGRLMGHMFELKLDQENWEYKYTPHSQPQCLPADSELRKSILFPDYMMPRFLMKMLSETYKDTDTDTRFT